MTSERCKRCGSRVFREHDLEGFYTFTCASGHLVRYEEPIDDAGTMRVATPRPLLSTREWLTDTCGEAVATQAEALDDGTYGRWE